MPLSTEPTLARLLPDASLGSLAPALDVAPLAVLIELVRRGAASTRPELEANSGLSRKVVSQRVERAIEIGLIEEAGLAPSGGGRQARTLRFRAEAGRVLVASLGASEFTAAIADLDGTLLRSSHEDWEVSQGPEATMARVLAHFRALSTQEHGERPWAICIGVPGPVDFTAGRLVSPPIMPGWDAFSVRSWLRDHYDAPVWVDNDVNLMALGEWARGADPSGEDMLFVKVGTGIGSALISRGRLIRGRSGAAGDIGHIHVTDDPHAVCRCGKAGCLEAVASGWHLLSELKSRAGESVPISRAISERGRVVLGDVAEAVIDGDPVAVGLVESSAVAIGEVLADLANFANPAEVVIGGGVLRAGPRVRNIIADAIGARSTDIVTDQLVVREATLDQHEGVTGAALLATENVLAPAALTSWVEDGRPYAHAVTLQRRSVFA